MKKIYKVLLAADSSAHGATTATESIFPYLRRCFEHLATIGDIDFINQQGHLPLNDIYDITGRENDFDAIVKQYNLFISILDFSKAERAVALGIPTVLYDPLAWYWPQIPDVAQRSLYVAPGFHGVREKLLMQVPHGIVVPPLVPAVTLLPSPARQCSLVLLNLGGFDHKFYDKEISLIYAHQMITAFKKALPAETPYKIVTTAKMAQNLPDMDVTAFNREEMKTLLPHVEYAVQTPGLSNIYDAAAYDIPTLFLPPVHGRQGQQLKLLQEKGTIDASLDWPDVVGQNVNYQDQEKLTLNQLQDCILTLNDPFIATQLINLMNAEMVKLNQYSHSATVQLLDKYGRGGAEMVGCIINDYANTLRAKQQSTAINT